MKIYDIVFRRMSNTEGSIITVTVFRRMSNTEGSIPTITESIKIDINLHVQLYFKGCPLLLPPWFRHGTIIAKLPALLS